MSELAVEYAKALYSLSADMKIEDKILDEIKEIKISLCENPDFIKLLNSPALSLEERHKVAEEALGGADVILVNFVKLLTEGRLVHIFSKCAKVFEDEYNLNHNIEVVTVESALPLSEATASQSSGAAPRKISLPPLLRKASRRSKVVERKVSQAGTIIVS